MNLFDNFNGSGEKPEAGKALISEPFLFDSNFRRAVILLCEYDKENGSMGFILNRKLDVTLSEVMEINTTLKIPLYLGGPVQNNTLHFLHADEKHSSESVDLGNGIYWGGNFEELVPDMESGILDISKYRFFLGYSGWGQGQLEEEMEINSWIITDATKKMVFGKVSNGALWKNTLNSMGGSYKIMAGFPESPFLN